MPYIGFNQNKLNKEAISVIDKLKPLVSVYFVPVPLNIDSLFKFKDKLPRDMISGIV